VGPRQTSEQQVLNQTVLTLATKRRAFALILPVQKWSGFVRIWPMTRVSRDKVSPSIGFVAVFCRGTGFAPANGRELKDLQSARVTRLGVVRRR
jgi:hypothetical protein